LKKEKKPTIRYANQPFYASQCGWIRAQMTTMMTMTRIGKWWKGYACSVPHNGKEERYIFKGNLKGEEEKDCNVETW